MTSTVTAVTFDRCWHVSRVLSQWLQYTIKFYSCQDLSNRILYDIFAKGLLMAPILCYLSLRRRASPLSLAVDTAGTQTSPPEKP